MRLIAITTEQFWPGESRAIMHLLEGGDFWRIHIRKPRASSAEVGRLLREVEPELRSRLTIHYHFDLAGEFVLGGVHLNARCPQPPEGWGGLVSRSCHSLSELTEPADYRFLSPVFDSISKQGYRARFTLEELRGRLVPNTFALGGVTPERLPLLESIGFSGAAMLGAAWKDYVTVHH